MNLVVVSCKLSLVSCTRSELTKKVVIKNITVVVQSVDDINLMCRKM